ncbi:restriction endonuclease subunit S [Ochrobactrum pseudogrignonense]|uniref:Restriction endonuclease subunit S n=1 Tax=Brucella pseudogrignonensis TaxID=419475 RepID=A0A7Y3T661_9HYPH|nr:restriction endonuclease subunit S [Brucella pseudogrignonensis]NNV21735.1 restriction endonuclease subunit S [Brucella pseudogrignonensis]
MSCKMPNEWVGATLGEVAKIEIGGTPSRNISSYWAKKGQNGVPWLSISDMRTQDIYWTKEQITEEGSKNSNVKLIKPDTVLMSFKLSIGKIAINKVPLFTNEAIAAITPDTKKLNNIFLRYLLPYFVKYVESDQAVKGKTLNKAKLNSLSLMLPPLTEQRRIAEILSSVDEAIAATQAMIEQTKKVKQATLERLLTKGIGHTRFKRTEIGEIPETWKTLQLQEVALVRTGLAKNKKEIVDTVELPYLRVANVQDGYIDLSDLRTINVSRSQIERYRLMQGDVLMTEGGDYDKLGRGDVWDGAVDPCLHQNHVFAVRTDQTKILPEFLALLTASRAGKAYFQSCSKQTTNLASINSTQVKEFPVRLPNLAEQHEILASINIQQELIKSMEVDINIKKKLKLALMSDLLTGRKRVTDTLPLAAE